MWGSAISYGKRYVALTLLGIATEDDDDGKAAGAGQVISDDQAVTIRDLIEATGTDEAAFCKYMGADKLSTLPSASFDRAITALKKKAGKITIEGTTTALGRRIMSKARTKERDG